jgi:hypothetical protein
MNRRSLHSRRKRVRIIGNPNEAGVAISVNENVSEIDIMNLAFKRAKP